MSNTNSDVIIVSDDENVVNPSICEFNWDEIRTHLNDRYGDGLILLGEPNPRDIHLCLNFLRYFCNDDYEEDCCHHWLQRFEKHRNTVVIDLSNDDIVDDAPAKESADLAQRKLEDIWEEHPKRLRSNLESPEKKSPRKSIFADIIDLSHLDDEDNEDVFEEYEMFTTWNEKMQGKKQKLMTNFY